MFWRDPGNKEDRLKFKLTAKIVLMYHECCRNSLSNSYSSYKKKANMILMFAMNKLNLGWNSYHFLKIIKLYFNW